MVKRLQIQTDQDTLLILTVKGLYKRLAPPSSLTHTPL